MLPSIQCHHTRGRAPLGGSSNPLINASAAPLPVVAAGVIAGVAWDAGAGVCAGACARRL